jgi:AcrR family transcriptional regulator
MAIPDPAPYASGMAVPATTTRSNSVPDGPAWASLSHDDKRQRALAVAAELFARDGIDIPMPEIADAVGVGVGSLYRQVGKKDDLIAALLLERIAVVDARFTAAAQADDARVALHRAVSETVSECVNDRLCQETWDWSHHRSDIDAASEQARAAMRQLVERARRDGVLRDDAHVNDLRMLFRSAHSAERLTAGGAQRLAELVLAGLAAPTST